MSDEKIKLYGTSWCGDTRRVRTFLETNHVDFEWIDIDRDAEAAKRVEEINNGYRSVPTLVFSDNSTLTEPSIIELSRKLGIN
jgi:mycoredoxin